MEDQQFEDLFDDNNTLPLPTVQPNLRGVSQRLDELHSTGCCQRLAWSNSGCVASISRNRKVVNLQIFARSPVDGTWQLEDGEAIEFPMLGDDVYLQHLAWGPLGQDLAVTDSAGRVSIFGTKWGVIGRMQMSRNPSTEPEHELGAAVGLQWLPIFPHQQKNRMILNATRAGHGWNYQSSDAYVKAPHNALENKSALVYVTRNGNLRLLFQQITGQWDEVTYLLHPTNGSDQFFSHAAFAYDHDSKLLVAAHEIRGRLHIFRVTIKWTAPPPHKHGEQPKIMAPPTFEVVTLVVEDQCLPLADADTQGAAHGPSPARNLIPAQLTHLEFLTEAGVSAGEQPLPALIAVFANLQSSMAHGDTSYAAQHQTSIICRWTLQQDYKNQLLPIFGQLASAKKKDVSHIFETVARFQRQENVFTHSIALSVMPFRYNTTIVFGYLDGNVEFRHTKSLQTISADYNTDHVSTLPQAGFAFNLSPPFHHVAFSANACVAATMTADNVVKVKPMEFMQGDLKVDDADTKYDAACAMLAVQHGSSCNQYFSGDDVFAILPQGLPEARCTYLLNEIYLPLNINTDAFKTTPQESITSTLGRNPGLLKCINAQNVLGFKKYHERTFSGNIAWAALQVRFGATVVIFILAMHRQVIPGAKGQQVLELRPEFAAGLVSVTKWMVDFLLWIFYECYTLAEPFLKNDFSAERLKEETLKWNSPAFILMLSSLTRSFLRDWQRGLLWIRRGADALVSSTASHSLELRNAAIELQSVFSKRPDTYKIFDLLINDVDSQIRTVYNNPSITAETRIRIEREMLITGEIPKELIPVAKTMCMKIFIDPKSPVLQAVDLVQVLFRDFSYTGLVNWQRAKAFDKKHVVDGIRKHDIPKNRDVKRCMRGCAYVEDLKTDSRAMKSMPWFFQHGKFCICGGSWVGCEFPIKGEKKEQEGDEHGWLAELGRDQVDGLHS